MVTTLASPISSVRFYCFALAQMHIIYAMQADFAFRLAFSLTYLPDL